MVFLSTAICMDQFLFVMVFWGRWKQHNCAASVPFPIGNVLQLMLS